MSIYIFTILLGGFIGFLLEKAVFYFIRKRVVEPVEVVKSKQTLHTLTWILLNSLAFFTVIYFKGINLITIEFIIIFSVCIVISAVDISIKKIPNESLLFILILGVIFILAKNEISSILFHIIGLIVGFIMFLLPALIGKGAGFGDVKFAAVVGFYLGVFDFLTAVIIMTLILLFYFFYLILTRKGNLKTKLALGPFLAFGFLSVMFLNLINSNLLSFNFDFIIDRIIQ